MSFKYQGHAAQGALTPFLATLLVPTQTSCVQTAILSSCESSSQAQRVVCRPFLFLDLQVAIKLAHGQKQFPQARLLPSFYTLISLHTTTQILARLSLIVNFCAEKSYYQH